MTLPSARDMFGRLVLAEGQSRAARSVEWFGWIDLVLGIIMLTAPYFTARVLHLPALEPQGSHYLRLVGLLVSGISMLYIVAGRLNSTEFAFGSMLDRPLVPVIMLVLWYKQILPAPLAIAFAASDFAGFLWTLLSWRKDAASGVDPGRPGLLAKSAAGLFGFTSGVVRNARTFHPDGRTFRGTIRPLAVDGSSLARAAAAIDGAVLLRIGMGVLKKHAPRAIARVIPDAPSVALRVYSASAAAEQRLDRVPGEDLDVLFTAGGDRLWKLLLNMSTFQYGLGLTRYDYFRNVYYADVPYRIDEGRLDVWLRLVPDRDAGAASAPATDEAREQGLTDAVARHATLRIEAQATGDRRAPFVPVAEVRFEAEIEIDQEALHFDPVEGRGFVPHGVLTAVRRTVYPASFHRRAETRYERVARDREGFFGRLFRS
jgi:hypothetical protein